MIAETGHLYKGVVPERAEAKVKLEDAIANRLVGKWWEQAKNTPLDVRDEIGKVYISKFLALGDDKAEEFFKENYLIFQEVGLAQWTEQPEITTPFWYGIGEIFPALHTPDEIAYLTSGNKFIRINNVHRFVTTFEENPGDPHLEPSKVFRNLNICALVYKSSTS